MAPRTRAQQPHGTKRYEYLLGDSASEAARLRAQSRLWDPTAHALFDRLGVERGWKVLEVGPGQGSLHRELRRRVQGPIDAVERSSVFAKRLRSLNARDGRGEGQIWQSDLLDAPLPAATYDLVFARWVFLFLPDPLAHLRKLAHALKPGGFLALEDYHRETFTMLPTPPEWPAFIAADRAFFASQGGDVSIGGRLPALYKAAGIELVEITPTIKVGNPDSPVWAWISAYFLGVMDRYARAAPFTKASAVRLRKHWAKAERDSTSLMVSPTVLDIVGRKPLATRKPKRLLSFAILSFSSLRVCVMQSSKHWLSAPFAFLALVSAVGCSKATTDANATTPQPIPSVGDSAGAGAKAGGSGGTAASVATSAGGSGGGDASQMPSMPVCPYTGPPIIDPNVFPACDPTCGGAHCLPESLLPPEQRSQLAPCSGGYCTPDVLIAGGGNAVPASCVSVAGAEGRCVSLCIPKIKAQETLLPKSTCAENERCAPCFDPVSSDPQKPTGACSLACDSPKSPPVVLSCPYQGPPLLDPKALPECSPACGGAHCVPSALVPASQQAKLATCTGGFCLPDKVSVADGKVPPASCTPFGGVPAEGRCLSTCLPSVAANAGQLRQTTCDTHELCVPCDDPITGADQGACHTSCDAPKQPTFTFPACCQAKAGPQGRCIPSAQLPADKKAKLKIDECPAGAADYLCVPDEYLPNATTPPQTCTIGFGLFSGACVSNCADLSLIGMVLQQETCPDNHSCVPCSVAPSTPGCK